MFVWEFPKSGALIWTQNNKLPYKRTLKQDPQCIEIPMSSGSPYDGLGRLDDGGRPRMREDLRRLLHASAEQHRTGGRLYLPGQP